MNPLNLSTLKDMGAFTGAPVECEIKWKMADGQEYSATVWVRRLSYHSTVKELVAWKNGTDTVAARISACICDAEGNPIFTPGDITGDADPARGPLDGELTMALLRAITEVNGLGGSKG